MTPCAIQVVLLLVNDLCKIKRQLDTIKSARLQTYKETGNKVSLIHNRTLSKPSIAFVIKSNNGGSISSNTSP